MIVRKGSVSAKKGERLLIPINMRDGSILAVGRGNPDWNYSAPHGAGRILSRGKAKEVLKVPPPPKDIPDRILQTLQFRIRVPDNAPENLYKVTVKQNGKVILQEKLSQIQNLDYQIPLELSRGGANHIDVEVTHKSGFTAKAKKVYEVR
jgi:hypothetical protein